MKLHHLNEQWHEAKLNLEERRKYLEWDVCSLGEYQQLIGQADSKRIEIESLIASLDSADREVPEVEEECKVPQDRDDYQFSLMGQYQGMGDWTWIRANFDFWPPCREIKICQKYYRSSPITVICRWTSTLLLESWILTCAMPWHSF